MSKIKSFSFNQDGVEKIREYKYGSDWPIVYVIENGKELYVGETFRAYSRTKNHLKNVEKKNLKKIHIISDDEANKSATLDIESSLIEYMVADGIFKLQNGNGGLQNHNYFDRERYQSKFEVIWDKLRKMNLAKRDWRDIRNSDIFKYSPYKTLTDEQYLITSSLFEEIKEDKQKTFLINGGPGTGKTIIATFLIKQLVDKGETEIALVIAMTALRQTLKKVFREIPGLKSSMVIGPSDVTKKKYKILLVDETHRLRQRRNIPNYGSFDKTNKDLKLPKDGDELDWITQSAEKVILFYDAKQSVRPSDISPEKITKLSPKSFELTTQMRVRGGERYLKAVDDLLELSDRVDSDFNKYDFKIFDDVSKMISSIKEKDKKHKLSRLVAGYAWKWVSKNNKKIHDIEIGKSKLFWNSKLTDWVNSKNAVNEVGCIHTIQGYDLNYAGVIIGPELTFNKSTNEIVVDRTKYFDVNGHHGVTDPEELKRYIINIYKTLLTRGILGTYVYICDENLRHYFKTSLGIDTKTNVLNKDEKLIESPYSDAFTSVDLPLFDSIGCGEAMFADSTVQELYPVPSTLISSGAKYFVIRTSGDSMNKSGITDGDLILCQKNYQAPSGSIAVVMLGDDATLKKIEYKKDGLLLKPNSTNSIHKDRLLTEGDDFKVLGVFVQKLENLE